MLAEVYPRQPYHFAGNCPLHLLLRGLTPYLSQFDCRQSIYQLSKLTFYGLEKMLMFLKVLFLFYTVTRNKGKIGSRLLRFKSNVRSVRAQTGSYHSSSGKYIGSAKYQKIKVYLTLNELQSLTPHVVFSGMSSMCLLWSDKAKQYANDWFPSNVWCCPLCRCCKSRNDK